MKKSPTPAAVPAAIFLCATYLGGLLLPTPVGALAVGLALSAALRGPAGMRLGALFFGLLIARLEPAGLPQGWDLGRPVEAVGRVAGTFRPELGGASAPLELTALRQGSRLWVGSLTVRWDLAGDGEAPLPGTRVRLRGHLGRAPGFANAHLVPQGAYRLRVKSRRMVEIESLPAWLPQALGSLRETVDRPLGAAAARHPGAGYARGLLLGELDGVPASERLAFRRSGLAHLLAVSGMNVALIAGVAAALTSFCGRTLRLVAISSAVMLHLALVGPVPSLLRATLMAATGILGLALERRTLALQALALAASAMVMLDPKLVGDLGFCLSCSATFGLVVIAPFLLRGWSVTRRPLVLALAVSWAAQAATLPWALAAFSYVSPAAPLLNLLAVPLAGLLLVAALGWIVIALAAPAWGDATALVLDLLAAPFRQLPALPTGPWLVLPLPPSWGLGLALAMVALVAARSPGSARRALLLGLLLTARPLGRTPIRDEAEWTVADVGQGDGSLLRLAGHAMLIDGGGSSSVRRGRDFATQIWLPLLADRGIARLDVVAVSHGDGDHCGGLLDVASYIAIGEVWATPELAETPCVRELLELSRARFRGLVRGERAAIGELRFEVLGPPREGRARDNDRSLVLAVEAAGRRLLFTGDIERRAELELLASEPGSLRCDLLKVAHHGSRTSSSERFLAAAGARLAVVSCGVGNRFGHPAPEVVERLSGAGRRLLRIDRVGGVVFHWRQGGPLGIDLPGAPRAVLPPGSG